MFKALLLQSWYNLSDPQLEKQLARDFLFHSFVDASVIQAHRNRPDKEVMGENTQDPEAGYSVKAGSDGKQKTTYGYKAHINVDEDDFIKATGFTAGNVHDSQCFADLLSGEESAVYADSAYASEATSDWLGQRHIANGVLERAYRNRPLTQHQKANNRRKSSIRNGVERVFGLLKLHYGMGQARYLGKVRNQVRFNLMCLAYNIKRGVTLQREMVALQASCA